MLTLGESYLLVRVTLGIVARRDESIEFTRKSTRGKFVLHREDYSDLGTSNLLGAYVDW